MNVNISIINKAAHIPEYKHHDDAGVDLCSCAEYIIRPGERKLVPTGICIQMPQNLEAQIRPRSGLALKHGITVLNSPGTIDAGYRGEIGVILINLGDTEFCVSIGDRIAQMVFSEVTHVQFELVKELNISGRGESGFGSTGLSDEF